MRGSLRSLDDGQVYPLGGKFVKIGSDRCDVKAQGSAVEREHALIEYSNEDSSFLIHDLNTAHGTYVNDNRVQNATVRLAHGDVIRLGHGGPKFQVLLDIQYNPPVIVQHAWDDAKDKGAISLPYLPLEHSLYSPDAASNAEKLSGGRYTVMPHPPVCSKTGVSTAPKKLKTRPLSASYDCKSLEGEPCSMTCTNGYYSWKENSHTVLDLEQRLLKMADEICRLAAFEAECFRKDAVIVNLRNEVADLKKVNLQLRNDVSASELYEKLTVFQNQCFLKEQEVQSLKEELQILTEGRSKSSGPSDSDLAKLQSLISEKEAQLNSTRIEVERVSKEKNQLTSLVSTLQREASAKDSVIKKVKGETEKLRVAVRNKDYEVSAIAEKMSKQSNVKEAEKEIKKKDEEIGNLRFRLKTVEEKLKANEVSLASLQSSFDKARDLVKEAEKSDKALHHEIERLQSQCSQLEHREQKWRLESQAHLKRVDRLHKLINDSVSGKDPNPKVLTDEDIMRVFQETLQAKDSAQDRLETVLREQEKLDHQVASMKESQRGFAEFYRELLHSLADNGRTSDSLTEAIDRLQQAEFSSELARFKELLCLHISHELAWEREIEGALASLTADEEKPVSGSPSVLIDKLRAILNENQQRINDLEAKICSCEARQQLLEESKKKIKEKYKETITVAMMQMEKDAEARRNESLKRLEEEHQSMLAAVGQEQRALLQKALIESTELREQLSKFGAAKCSCPPILSDVSNLRESLQAAKEVEKKLKTELEEVQHQLLQEKEKWKDFSPDDVLLYKEQAYQHSLTIVSLEQKFVAVSMEKSSLEMEVSKIKRELDEYVRVTRARSEIPSAKRDASVTTSSEFDDSLNLRSEVRRLEQANLTLRQESAGLSRESSDKDNTISSLRRQLYEMKAKMSDVAAELQEEQKRRIEELESQIAVSKREFRHQKQLLLDTVASLEQEKVKLREQGTPIDDETKWRVESRPLPETSGCVVGDVNKKDIVKKEGREKTCSSVELSSIGASCIGERHLQVIEKQKNALVELRKSLTSVEHLQSKAPSRDAALQRIADLIKLNQSLKDDLAKRDEELSRGKDELIEEVRLARQLMNSSVNESKLEKSAHMETKSVLKLSEDLYMNFMRRVSEKLGAADESGCYPLLNASSEDREKIAVAREKTLQVVLTKIQHLHERLERKKNLLKDYDSDLGLLRKAEKDLEQRNFEVKALQLELANQSKEIVCLREALRRSRDQINGRKEFLAARLSKPDPKPHSCCKDDQQKFKEQQRAKRINEKIKKNYEIQSLKTELKKADDELGNVYLKLLQNEKKDANVPSPLLELEEKPSKQ